MTDFFKFIIAGMLFVFSACGFLWWAATGPISLLLSAALTIFIVWLLNIKRRF